ncbi:MAG: hypothetical protein AB1631_10260 [Acidobacteriota bacterium]
MKSRKQKPAQTAFRVDITPRDLFANVTLNQHDDLAGRLFAIEDALNKGDAKAIKKIAGESRAKAFRALTAAAAAAATNEEARADARYFVREALGEAFRWSRHGIYAYERWERHVRAARAEDGQPADEQIAQESDEAEEVQSLDTGDRVTDKRVELLKIACSGSEDVLDRLLRAAEQ